MTEDICPSTCNDLPFCECVYGNGYEDGIDCTSVIASSCRSGNFVNCFQPDYITVATHYYCPFYECLDSENGSYYSGDCPCAAFTSVCEFCKENFADNMMNCAIGHPYDANYDGVGVCMMADCCASATTDQEKNACIVRVNETPTYPSDVPSNNNVPTSTGTETKTGESDPSVSPGASENNAQTETGATEPSGTAENPMASGATEPSVSTNASENNTQTETGATEAIAVTEPPTSSGASTQIHTLITRQGFCGASVGNGRCVVLFIVMVGAFNLVLG